jgi:hypothetical protein
MAKNEIAELLSSVAELVNAIKTASPQKEKKGENHKDLLQLGIDELRRLYDAVSHSHDNLRAKALALLVAEIAIVTFLFSAGDPNPFSVKIIYGIVFLAIGILCLIGSFVTFLWVISPIKEWEHPPETKDLKNIHKNFDNSPAKFLTTLKDDYLRCIPSCISTLSKRSQKFSAAVYLLSAGIFIILMIKYGGGSLDIVVH